MAHQITVQSITSLGEIEWTEVVTATNKAAASRKAYRIIWDCGHEGEIEKHVNEYDETLEVWRLK